MDQFDISMLNVHINSHSVRKTAQRLKQSIQVYDNHSKIEDLLFAVSCIDLTTLAGDDTTSNVMRLCWRAINPLNQSIAEKLEQLNIAKVTTGAVCVYPLRVNDCVEAFNCIQSSIPIASVVTGFPAGQGFNKCTLEEIKFATKNGATEIDIVINRTLVLNGKWNELYEEIKKIAELCKQCEVHLKVILSYGELGTLENVYKASMCAMMAGADFIKTSTGKESINAKLVYGLVMTRAIRNFYLKTGVKVGLKPAGGLKDYNDALCWVNLVRIQLGPEWMSNKLFRIGASSLLGNIESQLFKLLLNRNPNAGELNF